MVANLSFGNNVFAIKVSFQRTRLVNCSAIEENLRVIISHNL